jgi:transposase
MQSGRPAIEVGDIIVMDNLAVHHFDGGEILEEYFEEMGIELLFTPSYSPDLNPVEMCFSKIKAKLNGELQNTVHENLA